MNKSVSTKLQWYFNRLRAMSLREVMWRVSQQKLQRSELNRFAARCAVDERIFYPDMLQGTDAIADFNADFFGIRFGEAPQGFVPGAEPRLLGEYRYCDYESCWHAGFQTGNDWPLEPSYKLEYKGNDSIGDARCNWELNRHFQWPLLAADYYVLGNAGSLDRLRSQFCDWNAKNPFLWGISWTSVMEVAIRSVSWMLTLAFLKKAAGENKSANIGALIESLATGVLNMAGYVVKHRSRYSSANNHLLVEMTAVGLAGFAFGRTEWVNLAVSTLDAELERQNSADGVNLEMSLHYHAFVMEAYLLMMRAMRLNGRKVPQRWKDMLGKMAQFVAHSMVTEKTALEFGDADEGKIIDLAGDPASYYNYILQLASLECDSCYSTFELPELTISWLYGSEDIAAALDKSHYDASVSRTFATGGYSFLRSSDGQTLLAVDHAPLGFGSIAAHGHADAMSVQLYHAGKPVLIDSGTYLYHCNYSERDVMRSDSAHNTVAYSGHPQSEMLGSFLWGKQARVGISAPVDGTSECQELEIDGKTFDGSAMHRRIKFDTVTATVEITDRINDKNDCVTFLTGCDSVQSGRNIILGGEWIILAENYTVKREMVYVSPRYGVLRRATALRLHPNTTGMNRVVIQKINTQ